MSETVGDLPAAGRSRPRRRSQGAVNSVAYSEFVAARLVSMSLSAIHLRRPNADRIGNTPSRLTGITSRFPAATARQVVRTKINPKPGAAASP